MSVSPPPSAPPSPDLFGAITAFLPDMGLGGILGFATGMAVRTIGRFVLLAVGLLFIVIQLLAHWEIVNVDWLRLQVLTESWFRGQGEAGGQWLSRVLTANIPFAGSFTVGFLLGLKSK